jgi:hypothetical protein
LQRGQIRKPVSNLATDGGEVTGAINPRSMSESTPDLTVTKLVVEPELSV